MSNSTISERVLSVFALLLAALWFFGGLLVGAKCGIDAAAGLESPFLLKIWALSVAAPMILAIVIGIYGKIDP